LFIELRLSREGLPLCEVFFGRGSGFQTEPNIFAMLSPVVQARPAGCGEQFTVSAQDTVLQSEEWLDDSLNHTDYCKECRKYFNTSHVNLL